MAKPCAYFMEYTARRTSEDQILGIDTYISYVI